MTSGLPEDVLEKRAAEQRRQLHNSVSELRQTVREKLDVKRNLKEHVWPCGRSHGRGRAGFGLHRRCNGQRGLMALRPLNGPGTCWVLTLGRSPENPPPILRCYRLFA